MLDFIKKLSETETSKHDSEILKKIGSTLPKHRIMQSIYAGDYTMSIQASYHHYCEPRQTLENLEDYTEMEIALFKNKEWVQPRNDEFINSFPRYEELIDRYEPGDVAVGAYVSVDLIQDLYNYLSKQ